MEATKSDLVIGDTRLLPKMGVEESRLILKQPCDVQAE